MRECTRISAGARRLLIRARRSEAAPSRCKSGRDRSIQRCFGLAAERVRRDNPLDPAEASSLEEAAAFGGGSDLVFCCGFELAMLDLALL